MIDHVSVVVADLERSKELYKATLAPLGYSLTMDFAEYDAAGFGTEERASFWLGKGERAGGVHVAFTADSKEAVDAFHAAGLAAGAMDNGAPGYREIYAPNYYGAFIHDFDGNNIEAVYRDPSKPATSQA
jgi:catechol 2,3-dioxygenase-like lactoylglutathione lyase family enzyme